MRGLAATLLAVTGAAGAGAWAAWRMQGEGHGGFPVVAAATALALLFLPYFLFGLSGAAEGLRRRLADRPGEIWGWAAALLLPYLLYAAGTGSFSPLSLLTLVAYVTVPTALLVHANRSPGPFGWQDFAAVLALWLPFDFRLLGGIWPWPEGLGSYVFNAALGVDLAVLLFVCFRRWERVGYRFRLRPGDPGIVAANYLLFAAIAIPLGTAIGFIRFDPEGFEALGFLTSLVTIFLLIAVPEELLFRGLIQNFLRQILGREGLALAIAALVFGAAHLNNGPAPNWRYFLLASIAGIFYGRAYVRSGGLTGAAAVHALVDATWRAFFR